MPIRVASHLCRSRHGTRYCFRLVIPRDLRPHVGKREVRLSLHTEQRQAAIIIALPLIADLPRLMADLRRMADNNECSPPDYFTLWRDELFKNSALNAKVRLLESELEEQRELMAQMVPHEKAKLVGRIMHEKGQLRGKQELEQQLVFPWPPERTAPFSELQAAYLRSFTYRPDGGRKKPLTPKTLESYKADIGLFAKVMTDVRIGSIDREVAGEYFNILRKLPANISRVSKYRDKTIPELLAMNDTPQSETNVSKKMERISTMFKWALSEKRKWGIDANPFEGFGQATGTKTVRRPFTHDELRALLTHPDFVRRRFQTTYSYWLIPLAIYTGARLGELAQLDLRDFVEVDGIACIDINDEDAVELVTDEGGRKKRVKNSNAKRLVPIHPELVRVGILRYVAAMRERGALHLFPELSRTRRDGPAHAASNWFQRFRRKAGIEGKQETVFHSFRHLFITRLLDDGFAPHLVAPIVGHEAELITAKVYWNKKDATKRVPTVQAFALPADIVGLIPSVEDVTFTARRGPRSTA